MNNIIKVLVAYEHEVLAKGLSRLLSDQSDIKVIATVLDGEEAIEKIKELKPDVAIIDVKLSTIDGIEVARRVKSLCPSTAILMLSDYKYGLHIIPCLRAGALGYLLDSCSLSELISAIHSVNRGEEVLAPKAATNILHRLAAHMKDGDYEDLRERQLEILKLVCKGMTNRDIGKELNISERTVSTHLSNIFGKLGVNSRSEVIAFALKRGLVVLNDLG